MKKRIVSTIMCLAMLLSLLPVSAFAATVSSCTISGTVDAGSTESSVSGITVTLYAADTNDADTYDNSEDFGNGKTGNDGSYSITATNIESGNYYVVIAAAADGSYAEATKKLVIEETSNSITADITLVAPTQAEELSVSISGTARVGETLTAVVSPAGAAESVTFQWSRGDEAIDGAANSTYVLTENDVGKTITVTVSGKADSDYAGETATSSATDVVSSSTTAGTAPTLEKNTANYDATGRTATYTVTNADAMSDAVIKVYTDSEAKNAASGVNAAINEGLLVLTFTTAPETSTTYYVTAQQTDTAESVAVGVKVVVTYKVSGTVDKGETELDSVAGIVVGLYKVAGDEVASTASYTATVADGGTFSFDAVEAGTYKLQIASADKYTAVSKDVTVTNADVSVASITLEVPVKATVGAPENATDLRNESNVTVAVETGTELIGSDTLQELAGNTIDDNGNLLNVTSGEVNNALTTANTEGEDISDADIEVEVIPYVKVEVKSSTSNKVNGKTINAVKYDIQPVYDVVATATNSSNKSVKATVKSAQPMTISEPITVTIPLPQEVVTAMTNAAPDDGWYVKHEHDATVENIALTITGNNASFSVSNFSDMTLPLAVETVTVDGLGDLSSLDVGKDLTKAPYYTGDKICTGWKFKANGSDLFDGAKITEMTESQFGQLVGGTKLTAEAVTVAKAGTLSITVSSDGTISGDTAGDGNTLKYYIVNTDPTALLATISVESMEGNVASILGVSAEVSKPTLTNMNNGEYLVVVEFSGENKAVKAGCARISIGGGTTDTPGGGSNGGSSVSGDVTVSGVSNGKVTVTPTAPSKGATVTINLTPDTGYEVGSITVKDADGNTVDVTKVNDTTYTFVMPDGKVSVDATFTQVQQPSDEPFTDVSASDYFYDAVLWAVEKGITTGDGVNTFGPNKSCTRAQMVTFLWRAAGSPAATGSNPFADVPAGEYYTDAVLWAVSQGITNGTGADSFSPNATVSRGQTVTFLYRYAGSPAVTGSGSFGDVSSSDYYANAVQWAVTNGITNGTGNGTFSPVNDCTRGQIVTFMYRQMAE